MKRLSRLIWFAYFCGLGVWAVLAYKELLTLLNQGRLFALTMGGHPFISDFVMYYNGAILAEQCTAGNVNIYDPAVQNASLSTLTGAVIPELPFYLQYPPWFFALVRPLSVLSMAAAWGVWCLLGIIALLSGLYLLGRGRFSGWFERAFLVVAVLASFPTWLSFKIGQTSPFLFFLFVVLWQLLRARRGFPAGVAAGLIVIKLQYAPIVALVGLILGGVRFAAGFAVTMGVLLAISILTLGWPNVAAYPAALLGGELSGKLSGVSPAAMQNVRGLLTLMLGSDNHAVMIVSLLVLMVVAALLAVFWLRMRSCPGEREFEAGAALTMLVLLVSSPHTHVQDYLLAAIPAVWLYLALRATTAHSRSIVWLKLLLIAFPILSWLFFLFRQAAEFIRMPPYFIWALAVIALAVRALRKHLVKGGKAADDPDAVSEATA